MKLVIFANFFPYKRSEPFLKNEFEFSKKFCNTISLFTLYGKPEDLQIKANPQVSILPPVFATYMARGPVFMKGLFNLSPAYFHLKELISVLFYPKKAYRLLLSLFISRAALASKAFKDLQASLSPNEKTILYFYWGDNLCWIIPYLRKKFPSDKVKIIMRLHGSDLYEELKQNYAPLRNSIFENCDLLFTISEHGKEYLIQKYPQFKNKIQVSRLGVFDNGLNPHNPSKSYTVVSASNMVPLKRIDWIYAALQASQLPIIWYHFGDGPLMKQMLELVKTSQTQLKVHVQGYVKNEDLIQFYKTHSVDLFINLSTTEGLPVSIMEALSFGIPVMAPNIGGISEVVNATNGKLIPADLELDLIAKEVIALLESENSITVRENARRSFEQKVSAETNYSEFYQLLKKL